MRIYLILFLLPFLLAGQDTSVSGYENSFRNIKGLKNNHVQAIIQDDQGFIWVGTRNGLHKYDGLTFKVYQNNQDSTTVTADRITRLFLDSKRRLWVGTTKGVCRYNQHLDNFTRFSIPEAGNTQAISRVMGIVEDHDGNILLGVERAGLFSFSESTQTFHSYYGAGEQYELSSMRISDMDIDDEHNLWIGTEKGLNRLNLKDGSVSIYRYEINEKRSISSNDVMSVMVDHRNDVWVGTRSDGITVIRRDSSTIKCVHYRSEDSPSNGLGNNNILQIYRDTNNRIWVCNENGGLHLYDEELDRFNRFIPDPINSNAISSNSIWAVFVDSQEILWVGSALTGLDMADQNYSKFPHFKQSPINKSSLSNNVVRAFHEDNSGKIWIATDGGGLNVFDLETKSFRHYKHDPNDPKTLSSNAVLGIQESEGYLYLSTWAGGINKFDPRSGEFQVLHKNDHNLENILQLVKGSSGNLLGAGLLGGINQINLRENSKNSILNYALDVGHLVFRSVLEDSKGRIWAGTELHGLVKVEYGDFSDQIHEIFNHQEGDQTSLPANLVNHIYEDSKGVIWIATEQGLCRYQEASNSFLVFSKSDGLAADNVKSIIEDDFGRLWLGTSNGISVYNKGRNSFRNYSTDDGLQNGPFSRNSAYKLKDGRLLFGGSDGFNIIDPANVFENQTIPPVYLTGLNLFNEEVNPGDETELLDVPISESQNIVFNPNQWKFSFEFIALNFTRAENNQYAYMMEGLETEWNYVGNQRSATYTRTPPGKYIFRVKAANNDGIWNEEGISIDVIILPFWWNTWWFRSAFVITLIFAVLAILKYRVWKLEKSKIRLQQQINRRTKELEEEIHERKITELKLTSEVGIRKEAEANLNDTLREIREMQTQLIQHEKMSSVGALSAGIAHELNNPLNYIAGGINMLKNQLIKPEESTYDQIAIDMLHEGFERSRKIVAGLSVLTNNNRMELKKSDIHELIDYCFLIDVNQSNSAIKVERDYALDQEIHVYPENLKKSFQSILDNAFYYLNGAEEQRIWISTELNMKDPKPKAVISFENNGPKILQNNLSKIFDPFFTTKDPGEGVGLGLSICYSLVQLHKGEVRAENTERGVRFSIILPIASEV